MKIKKLLFLMLMAIFSSEFAFGQNANRNGFFLELGAGGFVGCTPRTSIFTKDNVMYFNCLSGAAADFGVGGRFRINNHWAYEVKGEGQFAIGQSIKEVIGRFLPVGFRYTSIELWKNYSLYAHMNIGMAMTGKTGWIYDGNLNYNSYFNWYGVLFPNMPSVNIEPATYSMDIRLGLAYSIGVGVNLTTHLYLEGCMNAQAMFNCYGRNGKGLLHYGMVAGIIGYRF